MSAPICFIAAEFARRAIQFHSDENPMDIELWGLFSWGDVSKYIKDGRIIPNNGFSKINRTIWCKPSQAFFDKHIKPIIDRKKDEKRMKSGIIVKRLKLINNGSRYGHWDCKS